MSVKERVDLISKNDNLSVNTPRTTAKIELTGVCTLGCEFCYNRIMKAQHCRQRFMTDEEFNKAYEYVKSFPEMKEIGLFYMGESGLHPKLAEYYKRVKRDGYFTFLTTNGTYIDHVLEALPWIDSLKVSWNYQDEADFTEKTDTASSYFVKICSNIATLYEACKELGKTLTISTVLDSDRKEYDTVIRMLKTLAPDADHYFIPLQTQGGTYTTGEAGVVGEADAPVTPMPCWSLFKGVYVDCDLNVRACCYGHTDEHILGNLKEEQPIRILDHVCRQQLDDIIPDMCKNCIR